VDRTLDLKGMTCPFPVIEAKKALAMLVPGATLTVLATDPAAGRDLAALCEAGGHRFSDRGEAAGVFSFAIRKRA